jgi:hypothetical protein
MTRRLRHLVFLEKAKIPIFEVYGLGPFRVKPMTCLPAGRENTVSSFFKLSEKLQLPRL